MKTYIPELQSASVFDAADLAVMHRAFEQACQEMGLSPDRADARAVVARAIFAAYQSGQHDMSQLNNAAWKTQLPDVKA